MPDGGHHPTTLASLAHLPRWVAWRTEARTQGGKPTKVPYAPGGGAASSTDPATWGTRAEAEPRARTMDGLGLVLGDYDGCALGGIDLDACRDPETGALEPWAIEVIERFDTYGEVSPSGAGVKLFFRYDPADVPAGMGSGRKFARASGTDHPPAIELYLAGRYFTITEASLNALPKPLRGVPAADLHWLVTEAGPVLKGSGGPQDGRENGGHDKSRSAKVFRKARMVRAEGGTYEDFVRSLDDDPATAAWKAEKGLANNERELRRAWQNAADAAAEGTDGPYVELTEDGVALAFRDRFRDELRYCHTSGQWHLWTGACWKPNRDKLAFSSARELIRRLNRTSEFKTQAITGKVAFAAGVERFAQADRAFAVTAEVWDRDPFLLGTPKGTVDLRTGLLRASDPRDMITRTTAATPSNRGDDCPTWLAFLHAATGGDEALIRFLQQWCGYCLTGDTREHALLFIYGPGGNGKSVFLNTVSRILGEYARAAPMDTFTASLGDRHPTDLAMLRGARMVTATETEEGRAWAESRIKQMTGGDPITARFMRQDFFTFAPAFKLTFCGNHKPALKSVDDANRRRFNIVPFIQKPATPDRDLEAKLWKEAPGILRWMIAGCLDWQEHGLVRPKVVTDATAEYFDAQDLIGRWIGERCKLDPDLVEKPGRLLANCQQWAKANGEAPPTGPEFRGAMEKVNGVRYSKDNGTRVVKGIGLNPPPQQQSDDPDDLGRAGAGV